MNRFLLPWLLMLLWGCTAQPGKKDYVITERNLVPEGTAFDSRTNTIYVGSTFKRKIIRITADGKTEDFIPEKYNGIASVLGMEVDEARGILWANTAHAHEVMPLKDPDPGRDWKTAICSFDLGTGKMIKKYELRAEKACFNDLTVTTAGDVFITESVNGCIYRVNKAADSLELFLQPAGFDFLNGITYSDKHRALFVSSVQGVIKIELPGKHYTLLPVKAGIDAAGIDGLTYYDNTLIGHQSSKVSVFHVQENGNGIVRSELLDSGPEFNSSTTGETGNGYYYFIVNSQIRSGIDRIRHTIKPVDSLQDIIIRRVRL